LKKERKGRGRERGEREEGRKEGKLKKKKE
jgi:hypothetical protein